MCDMLSNQRSFYQMAKGRQRDFLRDSMPIDLYPGKLRYLIERHGTRVIAGFYEHMLFGTTVAAISSFLTEAFLILVTSLLF